MKKEKPYIGCSSYTTLSWKYLFYPEELSKNKWFDYYCKHFNTYELNSTFYRFPTVKTLSNWYNKTPEDFMFSVKVPKLITHIHKFENCKEEIAKFYAICHEGLRDKLGCVLFQLPPSFSYTTAKLELIINSLDPGFKNVVEFRNESWWREDVFKTIRKKNITLCSVSYPGLPSIILQTAKIGYVRMHGNPNLFYSKYDIETINTLKKETANKYFEEVYIYFNNTASTAAIINALELKELIKIHK
ncbi:DUF72 domain-containing protein [Flavobacterium cerinum]|uniref:DUF72 domain-containing protein n=1 Tax=Flavobacterium cerinum TaxID=2502784 RepID=A0A3S3QLA6_9FLAO|nr:DUF72 domain-containing protein [Flavobacterium cerinum]RWX00570.1 DUF72 domain-containing protein [Flavobacterium cerinum]